MRGLGSRLRARWRALADAVRSYPHPVDDFIDATAGSQPADTDVVDLRPRVRMPGTDAGSVGPPPEWLAYVMSQDPVWIDGGLGVAGRMLDIPVRATPADDADVSTLTSGAAHPLDVASAGQRPVSASRPVRRPRARFVRPVPPAVPAEPADDLVPDFTSSRPAADPTYRPGALVPSFPTPAHGIQAPRRLLAQHQHAESDSSATALTATGVPVTRAPRDATADMHRNPASTHVPDPVTTPMRHDEPPVRPVAVPSSTPPLRTVPEVRATAPRGTAPAVLIRADRATLSPPPARALAPYSTPATAAPNADRAGLLLPPVHLRPVVDPWASISTPAPVIELRRDLGDRPAPTDPPVAVRWRTIDVDRLGLEQRAL